MSLHVSHPAGVVAFLVGVLLQRVRGLRLGKLGMNTPTPRARQHENAKSHVDIL